MTEKPILAAMLSIAGTELNDEEKSLLEKANPLGIGLFGRNIQNRRQLRKLTAQIKEVIGRDDVLIAIDQEGGRVRRLSEPEFRPYAAQIELGKLAAQFGKDIAEQTIRHHATLIAHDLSDVGINWNYAPVLDIAYEETSPVLKSRCFGDDEVQTARYGHLMIEAYLEAAVCPCMKHMPGHGRAMVDPHLGLPVLPQSLKELEKDFYPFIHNNQAPAGMTAHIKISEIDDAFPVTQSPKAIDKLIRGIIGFDGFLISDAIDMHALQGSLTDKVEKSLDAGCDAVCYCTGKADALKEIIKTQRFLTDKSMIRFAKIKNIIHNEAKAEDYEKIAEDYLRIVGDIEKYDDNYDATEILHKMEKLTD